MEAKLFISKAKLGLLVDEPGKADNEIVTHPHKQKVEFKLING